MLKSSGVKSNFIYSAIYQVFSLFIPLLVTPYVSRILEPAGIGEYSYTLSIVTYFAMIGVMGTTTHGQLVIAQNRNYKKKISEIFWGIVSVRFILSFVVLFIYLIFVFYSIEFQNSFLVLAILIIAQFFDITWFFQGLEEFKLIVFRNLIIRIFGVILIFIFIKSSSDLLYYILILQGSTLLGNISLWSYLKRYIVKVRFVDIELWDHLKSSIKYFIPTIATSIYTVLDKSMIGFFTQSTSENGFFEQAHKIQQIALTFITTLSLVTMPRFAFLFQESNNDVIKLLYRKTQKFVLMLSIPVTVGLIAISSNLIPWFLGVGYEPCINLLIIFSPLIIIVGMNNTIGRQCLMAGGKQTQYNRGVIIGAIVNFSINIVLIPVFHSIGAAIASVIAEFIILLVFIHYSKDFIKGKELFIDSKLYLFASSFMGIILYLIGLIGSGTLIILLQIFIGFLVYLIILLLFKDNLIIENIKILKNRYDKI